MVVVTTAEYSLYLRQQLGNWSNRVWSCQVDLHYQLPFSYLRFRFNIQSHKFTTFVLDFGSWWKSSRETLLLAMLRLWEHGEGGNCTFILLFAEAASCAMALVSAFPTNGRLWCTTRNGEVENSAITTRICSHHQAAPVLLQCCQHCCCQHHHLTKQWC